MDCTALLSVAGEPNGEWQISILHEVKQMTIKVSRPVRRHFARTLIAAMWVIAASIPVASQTKPDDCTPATFNMYVQQISTFRLMEFYTSVLLQAQFQAILQVDTGVKISKSDGEYFGPFARLLNITGRLQSDIKSTVNAGKRQKLDDDAMARLLEMSENADEIIAVGYEMIEVLEADEIIKATRMLNARSLPAHKDSMGASHTVISEIKSRSSLKALKCR
jgi:hypothetical protein